MNLTVVIDRDEKSFRRSGEFDEILQTVAQLLRGGANGGTLSDRRGDIVGRWEVSDDETGGVATADGDTDPQALAEYQELWTSTKAERQAT